MKYSPLKHDDITEIRKLTLSIWPKVLLPFFGLTTLLLGVIVIFIHEFEVYGFSYFIGPLLFPVFCIITILLTSHFYKGGSFYNIINAAVTPKHATLHGVAQLLLISCILIIGFILLIKFFAEDPKKLFGSGNLFDAISNITIASASPAIVVCFVFFFWKKAIILLAATWPGGLQERSVKPIINSFDFKYNFLTVLGRDTYWPIMVMALTIFLLSPLFVWLDSINIFQFFVVLCALTYIVSYLTLATFKVLSVSQGKKEQTSQAFKETHNTPI